jgi:hypothetical protein
VLRTQTDSRREAEREDDGAKQPAAQPSPAVADVLRLQGAAGNQAVSRLLARQPAPPPAPVAAGYAKTSPQAELSKDLHDEGTRIANAKLIIAFIRAQRGASPGATATFAPADLLADSNTVKKLKPKPTTVAELQPTLDLLVFHDVLVPAGADFSVKLDAKTNDVDTATFETAAGAIAKVTTDFDRRATAKDSIDPIGITALLDISIAGGQ